MLTGYFQHNPAVQRRHGHPRLRGQDIRGRVPRRGLRGVRVQLQRGTPAVPHRLPGRHRHGRDQAGGGAAAHSPACLNPQVRGGYCMNKRQNIHPCQQAEDVPDLGPSLRAQPRAVLHLSAAGWRRRGRPPSLACPRRRLLLRVRSQPRGPASAHTHGLGAVPSRAQGLL